MVQLLSVNSMIESLYKLLSDNLYYCFIKDDRYMYLVNGLKASVLITVFAAVIGLIIGTLLAIARISNKGVFSDFAAGYIAVIRGTPIVTQLLIIYFAILAPLGLNKELVAVLAFGMNSGAYVAEIIRAGIMAVDKGQMEAGRSLGLSYGKTMRHIIIPQAVKNILPALGNEFIVLLKETAIAGYIAVTDLNRGGVNIKSQTYNAFTPLLMVGYIYFLMTAVLSALMMRVERRMRQSD